MNAELDDVIDVIEKYADDFWAIVEAGWKSWNELPAPRRVPLDARARACNVWCYMKEAADIRFEGNGKVRGISGSNTKLYIFDDRVVVRFKKLDEQGMSKNIPTQAVIDFREQADLPGIPSDLPRLEVGYVLNALDTEIKSVLVAHPVGTNEVAWVHPLPKPVAARVLDMRGGETTTKTKRVRGRGLRVVKEEQTGTESE